MQMRVERAEKRNNGVTEIKGVAKNQRGQVPKNPKNQRGQAQIKAQTILEIHNTFSTNRPFQWGSTRFMQSVSAMNKSCSSPNETALSASS
jgi:hypothetical protein